MIGRRTFLRGIAATTTVTTFGRSRPAGAEPPPETRKLRLAQISGICVAPQYVASELLKLEGWARPTFDLAVPAP